MLVGCCRTPARIGRCEVPQRFLSSDFTLRTPFAGPPDRRSIRVQGRVVVHGVMAAENCGEHFSAVTPLEPVPCAGLSRRALQRVTRLPSGTATRTAGAGCMSGRTCLHVRRRRRDCIATNRVEEPCRSIVSQPNREMVNEGLATATLDERIIGMMRVPETASVP
jgi:hypothetical protein